MNNLHNRIAPRNIAPDAFYIGVPPHLAEFNERVPSILTQELVDWGVITSRQREFERWYEQKEKPNIARTGNESFQWTAISKAAIDSYIGSKGSAGNFSFSGKWTWSAIISALNILIQYILMSPEDRARVAFKAIVTDLIVGLGLARLGFFVTENFFELMKSIFSLLSESLPSLAKKAARFKHGKLGVVVVCTTEIGKLIKAAMLYLLSCNPAFGNERREEYRKQAKMGVTSWGVILDNLCSNLAAWACTTFVLSLANPPVGATFIVTIAVYKIVDFLFTHLKDFISTKSRQAWLPWIYSFFDSTEPDMEWRGVIFELMELSICEEIRCPITFSLVVDPVRYVPSEEQAGLRNHQRRRARVYERSALFLHLARYGTDPVTNMEASVHDYRRSPAAKSLAKEVASMFDANLIPVLRE